MAEDDIVASAFGRLYMNYLSTVCRKPCRMAGDDSWKCYNLIYFHNTEILFWYMILISLHFWSKFFATLNIILCEVKSFAQNVVVFMQAGNHWIFPTDGRPFPEDRKSDNRTIFSYLLPEYCNFQVRKQLFTCRHRFRRTSITSLSF